PQKGLVMSRQPNAKELHGMKKGYMGKIPTAPPATTNAPRPLSAKEKHGIEKGYMGKIPTAPPPNAAPPRPSSPAPSKIPTSKQTPSAKVAENIGKRAAMTSSQKAAADAKSNYQTIPETGPAQKLKPQQQKADDRRANYQTMPGPPPKPSASKPSAPPKPSAPKPQMMGGAKGNTPYANVPKPLMGGSKGKTPYANIPGAKR